VSVILPANACGSKTSGTAVLNSRFAYNKLSVLFDYSFKNVFTFDIQKCVFPKRTASYFFQSGILVRVPHVRD
jgi:hypothetical protein